MCLGELAPILGIYEDCARAILGEVEEANVFKLHRFSGKVTYLVYDDFQAGQNPALHYRIKVDLPNLAVDFLDYSHQGKPASPRYRARPSQGSVEKQFAKPLTVNLHF